MVRGWVFVWIAHTLQRLTTSAGSVSRVSSSNKQIDKQTTAFLEAQKEAVCSLPSCFSLSSPSSAAFAPTSSARLSVCLEQPKPLTPVQALTLADPLYLALSLAAHACIFIARVKAVAEKTEQNKTKLHVPASQPTSAPLSIPA